MPIKRISDQKSRTLEEFYFDVSNESNVVSEDIGKTMLAFIKEINEVFPTTTIWALTSLYRLVLLTEDDWKSKWYVIVSCLNSKEIYIEYLMPSKQSPWPDAIVKGTANSLNEATKYVLIAMKESNGWLDNEALKKSLRDANL